MRNFLFSTNTFLKFILSERYYAGTHFVWCTPYFEVSSQNGFFSTTPPTSTPKEIYQSLAMEVERKDGHSSKIKDAKAGLRKEAKIRLASGEITHEQFEAVRAIIDWATLSDFRPLLYVINYEAVKRELIEVPIERRAHPLSVEYQIERLKREHFEVLELPTMKI